MAAKAVFIFGRKWKVHKASIGAVALFLLFIPLSIGKFIIMIYLYILMSF